MASFQNISAITLASLFSVFVNGCPQPPKTYVRPSATNGGEEDPAIRAIEAAGGTCFRYQQLKGLLVQRNRYWLKETEGNPVVAICVSDCNTPKQLIDDIAKFKHIQSLCIQKTALTDQEAAVIAGMPTITELRLENTTFTGKGISELAKLKLEHLNFDFNQTGDKGLEIIATIKTLKELHLNGTMASNAGYAHLANLTELKYLSIGDTKLTDAVFAKWSGLNNLEELSLNGANISSDGFKHLKNSKIRKLDLIYSEISPAGFRGIAKLKRVEEMSLFHSSGADTGLKSLAEMKNLQSLNLYGTSVTVEGLKNVAASKSLRHVDVTATEITHSQCRRFNRTSGQCRAIIVDD